MATSDHVYMPSDLGSGCMICHKPESEHVRATSRGSVNQPPPSTLSRRRERPGREGMAGSAGGAGDALRGVEEANKKRTFVPVKDYTAVLDVRDDLQHVNESLQYDIKLLENRVVRLMGEKDTLMKDYKKSEKDKQTLQQTLTQNESRVGDLERARKADVKRESHLEKEVVELRKMVKTFETQERERRKQEKTESMRLEAAEEAGLAPSSWAPAKMPKTRDEASRVWARELETMRTRLEKSEKEKAKALRSQADAQAQLEVLNQSIRKKNMKSDIIGNRKQAMRQMQEDPDALLRRLEELEESLLTSEKEREQMQFELEDMRDNVEHEKDVGERRFERMQREIDGLQLTLEDLEKELEETRENNDRLTEILLSVFDVNVLTVLKSKQVRQVCSGSYHTMTLTKSGELYTWGYGAEGQLGQGDTETVDVPMLVQAMEGKVIKQIAAGANHSVALTERGHVYTWGLGEDGQLGHGDRTRTTFPRLLEVLTDKRVVRIGAGWTHTTAVTDEGEVYTWGNGFYGQLGHKERANETIPRLVKTLPLAVKRALTRIGAQRSERYMRKVHGKGAGGDGANSAAGGVGAKLSKHGKKLDDFADVMVSDTDKEKIRKAIKRRQADVELVAGDMEKVGTDLTYLQNQLDEVLAEKTTLERELRMIAQQLPFAGGEKATELAGQKGDKEALVIAVDELINELTTLKRPKDEEMNRLKSHEAQVRREIIELEEKLYRLEEAEAEMMGKTIMRKRTLDSGSASGSTGGGGGDGGSGGGNGGGGDESKQMMAESGGMRSALDGDTEAFLEDLFEMWKRLNEVSVERIQAPRGKDVGLRELVTLSNGAIDDIMKRAQRLITEKRSITRDMLSALFMDNAELRRRINDYYMAVMEQTIRRMEGFQQQTGSFLMK